MPVIKIEKVVSFSSEDPIHLANNILSSDPAKKWKCRTQGEKSASIVLQLEKACVISSIDIGNESSAYIEVLVSRSSTEDDFKVLLVMSSFMTPMEARQGLNVNKVRMFNRDQLSKPECDEKWDRLKIVCTQPFNRHMQYGLSFITFHSPNEKEASAVAASTLAKFVIRPDSPDNLTAGSLFARRKELQENTSVKAAAAIRQATSLALESQKPPSSQKKLKFYAISSNDDSQENENDIITERNRKDLLYTKDEEQHNSKIDYIVEQKNKETKQKQEKAETSKQKVEKKESVKSEKKAKAKIKQTVASPKGQTNAKPSTSTSTDSTKRKLTTNDSSNKKLKQGKPCKPFNQLFDGIVFVISGIQNPDRADLRAKAMSMGAKYKSDWDSSCTHLICAFPNTPKFNQVRGKGKIVTKNWINDCNSKRKRLPWRRYALDKRDQGKAESEEEICELSEQQTKITLESTASTSSSTNERKYKTAERETPAISKAQSGSDTENDEVAKASTSLQKINGVKGSHTESDDSQDIKNSGTDTEDEIERIQKLQKKTPIKKLTDIFSVDTDEEDTARVCGKNGNPSLPDFFTDKTFYIDPNLSRKDKALLVKYITAFNGVIKENLNGSIDIVISSTELRSTLSSSSKADIVSPDYIWECHNSQTLIPVDKFKL